MVGTGPAILKQLEIDLVDLSIAKARKKQKIEKRKAAKARKKKNRRKMKRAKRNFRKWRSRSAALSSRRALLLVEMDLLLQP